MMNFIPPKVRVVKFIAIESGTYNDIVRRPFESHMNMSLRNDLMTRLDPRFSYNTGLFADLSTELIAPSAVIGSDVNVTGGWATSRLRWILVLEWVTQFQTKEIQALTGYSDPVDFSYAGNIDPRTNLYVNNSFHFRSDTVMTPNGPMTRLVPSTGGQVMVDNQFSSILHSNPNYLGRPSDVIMVNGVLQAGLGNVGGFNTHVSRSIVDNNAKFSSRSNANPANFVQRVMDSTRKAIIQGGDFSSSAESVTLDSHRNASDLHPRRDAFLSFLQNVNQSSVYGNTFNVNQLMALDPNLGAVSVMLSLDAQRRANVRTGAPIPIHERGMTADWKSSNKLTMLATTLANAIPGIMADNAISAISMTFTNEDGGGTFVGLPSRALSFIDDVDLSVFVENFKNRVIGELLTSMSHNHGVLLRLTVHSELLGDTWLEITYGTDSATYAVPTFCDALYTPVLHDNLNTVQNIAGTFGQLINDSAELYGQIGQPQMLDQTGQGFDPLNQSDSLPVDTSYFNSI